MLLCLFLGGSEVINKLASHLLANRSFWLPVTDWLAVRSSARRNAAPQTQSVRNDDASARPERTDQACVPGVRVRARLHGCMGRVYPHGTDAFFPLAVSK